MEGGADDKNVPPSNFESSGYVAPDLLQQMLHAAWMVTFARSQGKPGHWLAQIGEMDWTCELRELVAVAASQRG